MPVVLRLNIRPYRELAERGLAVAKAVAALTKNPTDDRVVEIVGKLLSSEELWAGAQWLMDYFDGLDESDDPVVMFSREAATEGSRTMEVARQLGVSVSELISLIPAIVALLKAVIAVIDASR